MLRTFVDANVLFAGAYSTTGYARDLILLAIEGHISFVVSQEILDETEHNLSRKAPSKVASYRKLLSTLTLEVVDEPEPNQVWIVEEYVAQKDASIIAAAIAAKPDYFVTYDHKYLLEPPEVAAKSGLKIVTPDVVVHLVQSQEE